MATPRTTALRPARITALRLLHTSDWHLGRAFHGAPLLDEQVAALDAMVALVRAEAIDVVVVAGDLYDRQLPPVDAVEALSHAFAELRAAGARVVAISGNHDSNRRLAYGASLLAQAGVSVCSDPAAAGRPLLVPGNDGHTEVAIYPIAYLEPEVARHQLDAPDAKGHEAVLRVALDRARADAASRRNVRTVVVAHAFAAGGRSSDSERKLAVGGCELVPLRCFDGFDYVALGHLHGRQVFSGGRVRYSGSPLPYSFSERDQRKSVEIVDIAVDGTVRAEIAPLPEGRRLAALRGTFDDLTGSAAHAHAEACWVQATVTDVLLPRDTMARLRQRFPHMAVLLHEPAVLPSAQLSYRERTRGLDDLTLVSRFLEEMGGAPPTPAERGDLVVALSV